MENDVETMKNSIANLEAQLSIREKERAIMNEVELHKAMHRIKNVLQGHYWQTKGTQAPSDPHEILSPQLISQRNAIAHDLNLEPCLSVAGVNSSYELAFEALFGVPSAEAKALYELDKTQTFQVVGILTLHAEIWKLGVADEFVSPFHQWLGAMRSLLSMPNMTEVDGDCISITRLAEETRAKGVADLQAASASGRDDVRKLRHKLRGGKGLIGEAELHGWGKIVEDWKVRGI